MNKAKIDAWLPLAYQAIAESGIPDENGKVQKSFRGQISSFGAAVTMGSLLAAIAFFAEPDKAKVDRSKLLNAIYHILIADGSASDKYPNLYDWAKQEIAKGNEPECREAILNAAIAVKLALNLYPFVEKERTS